MISKLATNFCNLKDTIIYYDSAREALSAILKKLSTMYEFTILLPNYIGYSSKEGSGIFDPIVNNSVKYIFYKLNSQLEVDIRNFEDVLKNVSGKKVVLLVHYFGYVDKNYEQCIELMKACNAYIIEDCAHSLFTDYVDHKCGNLCDASIYSIHKLLPYKKGGMLKLKDNNIEINSNNVSYSDIFSYNMYEISNIRKNNSYIYEEMLSKFCKKIKILRKNSENYCYTPQTFPLIFKNVDKSMLYFKLNELGFGVVSLYHNLISQLRNHENEYMVDIGQSILNLPVHQDVTENQAIDLCNRIAGIVNA